MTMFFFRDTKIRLFVVDLQLAFLYYIYICNRTFVGCIAKIVIYVVLLQ